MARPVRAFFPLVLPSSLTGLRFKFRVRVRDDRQISSARSRVEVRQQSIISLLLLDFGDLAVGIVEIAEMNRAGRASLLARSDHLPVAHLAGLALGGDAAL